MEGSCGGCGVTEGVLGGRSQDGRNQDGPTAAMASTESSDDSDGSGGPWRAGCESTVSLHSTSDTEAACGVSECGRDEGLEGGEAWRCARCWVSTKGGLGFVLYSF